MALAKTYCISLIGLVGRVIEVEADISAQLPGFVLVGLPDASLAESAARVRAASANSGTPLPARKITVNLSPASVPKFGSGFDLAIAIATLAAAGTVKDSSINKTVFLGELGLDGSVRPINGVLPSVMAAKKAGFSSVVVPAANLSEANLVSDMQILGVQHLTDVLINLGAEVKQIQASHLDVRVSSAAPAPEPDISEIYGQESVVDALVIAAAGGHHLLMVGPPGVGKTMMAQRMTTLLPDLELEQALETTAIHSVVKNRGAVGSELITRPPFEAPHHTASATSLVGGGVGLPSPGLISLAHNGVLFLDEAPEFSQPSLESLRQALESGEVSIARSAGVAKYPARFQLLLAANPCPCGHALSIHRSCVCGGAAKVRYLNRLSGPLLDRVDVRLQVKPVTSTQIEISKQRDFRMTSAEARIRVVNARAVLSSRLSGYGYQLIGHVPASFIRNQLRPSKKSTQVLDVVLARGKLSLRGYDRCLRIGYSIAALDGRDSVNAADIDQAFLLRGSDDLMAVS